MAEHVQFIMLEPQAWTQSATSAVGHHHTMTVLQRTLASCCLQLPEHPIRPVNPPDVGPLA